MIRFRQLEVWNEAKELTLIIYKVTDQFPDKEKYGLISQMQRAAISVVSNIAEGAGRHYKKEFIQFLHLARGSLYELLAQTEVCFELDLIEQEEFRTIENKCIILTKRLNALIKSLNNKP